MPILPLSRKRTPLLRGCVLLPAASLFTTCSGRCSVSFLREPRELQRTERPEVEQRLREKGKKMYKKIMVPLDGSKFAERVLPHVETVIKGCESPEVILVRAVESMTIPCGREAAKITSIEQLTAFEGKNKLEAEKYLKEIVARLGEAGVNAKATVMYGKATEALSDFATKNDVDLVVIATHGRSGISRRAWGSVAERLLRSVCVPVLMVRVPGCGLGT